MLALLFLPSPYPFSHGMRTQYAAYTPRQRHLVTVQHLAYGRMAFAIRAYSNCDTLVLHLPVGHYIGQNGRPKALYTQEVVISR